MLVFVLVVSFVLGRVFVVILLVFGFGWFLLWVMVLSVVVCWVGLWCLLCL